MDLFTPMAIFTDTFLFVNDIFELKNSKITDNFVNPLHKTIIIVIYAR